MNTRNPWKTLSSELKYQNPWMRVREDQVIRPDGQPGVYGVVESKRVATGVVALTAKNEIYLVGQYRYPTKQYSWELIEGGAEPSETPLAGAQRELQEEAGLIAQSWEQLGGEIHLSNCITSEIAFLFLARELSETKATPEGTEILTVRKVPFSEALSMVESGEIKDAMTIMGVLRAARRLRV